jgi:hypothetical protein
LFKSGTTFFSPNFLQVKGTIKILAGPINFFLALKVPSEGLPLPTRFFAAKNPASLKANGAADTCDKISPV